MSLSLPESGVCGQRFVPGTSIHVARVLHAAKMHDAFVSFHRTSVGLGEITGIHDSLLESGACREMFVYRATRLRRVRERPGVGNVLALTWIKGTVGYKNCCCQLLLKPPGSFSKSLQWHHFTSAQFSTLVLAASRASRSQENSYHYLPPLTLHSSCQEIAQTLPRNALHPPQRQTLPRRAATESQRSLLLKTGLGSLVRVGTLFGTQCSLRLRMLGPLRTKNEGVICPAL
jgi:hypothetical protein